MIALVWIVLCSLLIWALIDRERLKIENNELKRRLEQVG